MSAQAPILARSMGQPITRVDGRLKVTGAAKYAAEFAPPEAARSFLVMSTIAKGTITELDASAAEKAPGVLAVITHLNAPKLKEPPKEERSEGIRIERRVPFADATIHYGGQYVALVVAETLEQARYAAGLVRVTYASEKPALTKEDAPDTAKRPKENQEEKTQVRKGNVGDALANADFIRIEHTYSTPTETHNPMENSATVAVWEDAEHLTIYDATQFVKGVQSMVAQAFGLKRENVRVHCPFVGGAFGCKGPVWGHTMLAPMAAKLVGRPVRVELSRHAMFSGTGHRTPTQQTIALAAARDGKLQAIRHRSDSLTSPVGEWVEMCGVGATNVLYDSPNIEFTHTVFTVNVSQPSFMRAPGECPGTYGLECAMDEMAYALGMDPLQFRIINESRKHPIKDVPWSTKHLRECYDLGAEKFGWAKRTHEAQSMRDGEIQVGWGVATATYPAKKWEAEARIEFRVDGTARVRSATHDLGTGAYTAFTQISADAIGIPIEQVKFELGTSDYPYSPVAGGSNTTATVGSAIVEAARDLHGQLAAIAVKDATSPLHGLKPEEMKVVAPGKLGLDDTRAQDFTSIMKRAGHDVLVADGKLKAEEDDKQGFQSFGAHFVEVRIDPAMPLVRVSRVVSVMDCGQVVNPKTGGNQIIGGVVMGIGMALEEETIYDPPTGLPVNRNLADYHVPVNADIHSIEAYFVGEPDYKFNPMGARGMGEIGITGITAAIANAVFHATGKRVRDLPITLDKLL